MSDVIRVRTAGYDRYEELLLQQDRYEKDADDAFFLYVHTFGEEIRANFEIKVECIHLRKSIEFCQAALNHGKKIDPFALEQQLAAQMQEYYEQLRSMAETNEACWHLRALSAYDEQKIKKLYHELARRLHPDLHPETAASDTLTDLWHRVVHAYKSGNLKELSHLQVLVLKALSDLGLGSQTINIPDVEERIAQLEQEIEDIVSRDPSMVEDKHKALKEEKQEYQQAYEQLKEMLSSLMDRGGVQWVLN